MPSPPTSVPASWPGPSARRTAPRPSRRTSTTRASATSPSTSSSRPISSRPKAWPTAASTSCSSRRSSTPSTPRRLCSHSTSCSSSAAAVGRSSSRARSPTPRDVRCRARRARRSGTRCATASRWPSASTVHSARTRCDRTSPRSPASQTVSFPATRTRGCRTPSVSTTRRPTRWRGSSRRSPPTDLSTSSVDAAARPRTISRPSRKRSRSCRHARCPRSVLL